MPRLGTILVGAGLVAIIALAFVWPQPMLAPGAVMPAHKAIAQDCFACHTPLQGAASDRCITCHTPAKIGIFTASGQKLVKRKVAFHQQLLKTDCMACHSDHAGPALTGHSPTAFRHTLLQPDVQSQCAGCHAPPANLLHRQLGQTSCSSCHSTSAWRPATFAHDRLFRLEGDHRVACVTCHTGGNLTRYTCYGCHEHQPDRILAEHREEGVRGGLDNCVRCHRSANGEDGEGRRGDDDE